MMSHKTFTFKTRFAFTMIELVFVIVVLGILAALALPRMERDLRQEAADNILSAIRYTQHLALNDDKHKAGDPDWHQELWTIRFSNALFTYTLFSDADQEGNADINEIAIDPANGKNMDGTDADMDPNDSPNVFLADKYGIDGITLMPNTCTTPNESDSLSISFDNFGRPHRGVVGTADTSDLRTYVNTNCQFKFTSAGFAPPLVIEIERETGYAFIVGQLNS